MQGFLFCSYNPWRSHGQCYIGNIWQTGVLTCLCSKQTAISSSWAWWDSCPLWQSSLSAFTSGLLQGNHKAREWQGCHWHTFCLSLSVVYSVAKTEKSIFLVLASKIPECCNFQKHDTPSMNRKCLLGIKTYFFKHPTLTLKITYTEVSGYKRRSHHKICVWNSLFELSSLVENKILQVLEN